MAKVDQTVELGDKVKCRVTGFTGNVTSVTHYINQCDRFSVQPECGKDGKYPEAWNIDVHSLEVIKKGHVKVPEVLKKPAVKTGGPSSKVERF